MKTILKKITVILLAVVMVFNLTCHAFAANTPTLNTNQTIIVQSDDPTDDPISPNSPRIEWLYSTTPPSGITYSSTPTISTGNTKLYQTLESILVGVLAGYLAYLLPIPTQAQIVAGAILSSLPTAYNGSTTLYYRMYTYMGSGAYQYYNKKCSVYYYYDADMTVFASHAIYYGQKSFN